MNNQNEISTSIKGDDNMKMVKNNFQTLDVNFILTHGANISSQQVLTDVTPVKWDKDTLSGKYKDNVIAKITK